MVLHWVRNVITTCLFAYKMPVHSHGMYGHRYSITGMLTYRRVLLIFRLMRAELAAAVRTDYRLVLLEQCAHRYCDGLAAVRTRTLGQWVIH